MSNANETINDRYNRIAIMKHTQGTNVCEFVERYNGVTSNLGFQKDEYTMVCIEINHATLLYGECYILGR